MSVWQPSSAGRPPGERARVLAFVVAALALHLVALPLLRRELSGLFDEPTTRRAAPVQVVAMTPAVLRALRENKPPRGKSPPTRKQPQAAPPAPKRAEPEPEALSGQVVDLPPSADDRALEDAKYLSEHNTRTERETRSRYQSQQYKNAMNEPTITKRGELAAPAEQQEARALEIGPEAEGREEKPQGGGADATALELPRVQERQRLALQLDDELGRLENQSASEALQGNSDRLRLSLGDADSAPAQKGSAPRRGPTAIELVPQVGVLAQLAGAPSNDHLEDLEIGDGTFLNSREFKYASFFNRLKRGVSAQWRPLDEYRRRDPSGNIYGYKSRVTVLSVTLKADGTIKQIEVSRSSGVEFLDREAMAAFQRAEPFPNPPKGLMKGDGEITFPFGFHVDFSGAVPF